VIGGTSALTTTKDGVLQSIGIPNTNTNHTNSHCHSLIQRPGLLLTAILTPTPAVATAGDTHEDEQKVKKRTQGDTMEGAAGAFDPMLHVTSYFPLPGALDDGSQRHQSLPLFSFGTMTPWRAAGIHNPGKRNEIISYPHNLPVGMRCRDDPRRVQEYLRSEHLSFNYMNSNNDNNNNNDNLGSAGSRVVSFVLMGGTETGRRPLPLAPSLVLLHIQVDCGWAWHTSDLFVYGESPPPRYGHSATEMRVSTRPSSSILVVGGVGPEQQYLRDVFMLHTHSCVWQQVVCCEPIPVAIPLPPNARRDSSWRHDENELRHCSHTNASSAASSSCRRGDGRKTGEEEEEKKGQEGFTTPEEERATTSTPSSPPSPSFIFPSLARRMCASTRLYIQRAGLPHPPEEEEAHTEREASEDGGVPLSNNGRYDCGQATIDRRRREGAESGVGMPVAMAFTSVVEVQSSPAGNRLRNQHDEEDDADCLRPNNNNYNNNNNKIISPPRYEDHSPEFLVVGGEGNSGSLVDAWALRLQFVPSTAEGAHGMEVVGRWRPLSFSLLRFPHSWRRGIHPSTSSSALLYNHNNSYKTNGIGSWPPSLSSTAWMEESEVERLEASMTLEAQRHRMPPLSNANHKKKKYMTTTTTTANNNNNNRMVVGSHVEDGLTISSSRLRLYRPYLGACVGSSPQLISLAELSGWWSDGHQANHRHNNHNSKDGVEALQSGVHLHNPIVVLGGSQSLRNCFMVSLLAPCGPSLRATTKFWIEVALQNRRAVKEQRK